MLRNPNKLVSDDDLARHWADYCLWVGRRLQARDHRIDGEQVGLDGLFRAIRRWDPHQPRETFSRAYLRQAIYWTYRTCCERMGRQKRTHQMIPLEVAAGVGYHEDHLRQLVIHEEFERVNEQVRHLRTRRQEVLFRKANGQSNSEIAAEFHTSTRNVCKHLRLAREEIYQLLGDSNNR